MKSAVLGIAIALGAAGLVLGAIGNSVAAAIVGLCVVLAGTAMFIVERNRLR